MCYERHGLQTAFYCVAAGSDEKDNQGEVYDLTPSPAKLKLTAFSHSGYA